MSKITSIGGQALLEGIMMVGPFKTVAAFCNPQGEITTEEIKAIPLRMKYPILGKPFVRGIFSFIDSLRVGMKALEISADKATEGDDEELSGFDKWLTDKLGDNVTKVITAIGSVLGVALAIVLFMLVPTLIFNAIKLAAGDTIEPFRALCEGVMRLAVFVGYIFLVSLMPDIKRVFMYHGAEHKTIFCYENDLELTVANVRKQRRFHPRCGTSFLIILILLGILIGMLIPATNPIIRTLLKLLTLPIVVSFGYELIKLCGRHDNIVTKIISAPGLWMQRITTKEPDDKMIETAIVAIKAVIPEGGEDLIKK
jgi:uncharacterized protein YqhQ